ncbi:putative ribonuclease H-like domain-containing protein [Tanacetum coccineum]
MSLMHLKGLPARALKLGQDYTQPGPNEEESKVVKKSDDVPIIVEWASDNEEENVTQPKVEKKIVNPSFANIEFVKPKGKTARKMYRVIDRVDQAHGQGTCLFLKDYEEIDGGYVAFGGNPKGGKITGKATKDETSGILKSFITGIENLVDHKVKVIRCDNGTEFKNREMNQFYEMKGILRQFSVARTPQQNGVAKRKNRTLIEAARTMLADSKLFKLFLWQKLLILFAMCKIKFNAVGGKTNIELLDDPNMPGLEDYAMNNLNITIQVSLNPTTRIHKDHPLDQVIGDLQAATQTRSMTKNFEEHGIEEQKGNSCIEGSKLDRGYAGRASTIQATRSLDFSGFTKCHTPTWQETGMQIIINLNTMYKR